MAPTSKSSHVGKKKSPRAKVKRVSKRTSSGSTPSAGVNSSIKGDQRKSEKDGMSEVDGPGSPTVVINEEMTARKLRLLNSSPIRDILANKEERDANAPIGSVKGGKAKDKKSLKISVENTAKVRKTGMTTQNSRVSDALSMHETVTMDIGDGTNISNDRSKSASGKLTLWSERGSSTGNSPPNIKIRNTVVPAMEEGGEVVEKVYSKEVANNVKSARSPKCLSGKAAASAVTPSLPRASVNSKSKRKSTSGGSSMKANQVNEDRNEDKSVPSPDEVEFLTGSEMGSLVNNLLHPAKEDDDVAAIATSENDANAPKSGSVEKRRKPSNRTSKRALLCEKKRDTGLDIETTGQFDTMKKEGVSKSIKKKRGAHKKAKKAAKDGNDMKKMREAKKKANDVETIANDEDGSPGVMYLGHIPHGFYEKQMSGFFSQFGRVLRVRVSRSWRTGKSSGFGFVMFADKDVAMIAAEAMDGYLMHGRRLKANFIPTQKVHKDLFKPKTSDEKSLPISELERRKILERSRSARIVAARSRGIRKEISRKKQRLERLGIHYSIPGITPVHRQQNVPSASTSTDTKNDV